MSNSKSSSHHPWARALARFSVEHSLLVNLLSVFVFAAGLTAMFHLQRDTFPQVDFDIVTVTTVWPSASPEDVEKFVTTPIEKELKGISGIKKLQSSSDEGLSTIGITIEPSVDDKKQVVDDIKEAVDRVRDLPEGVEEDPLVVEIKSKERPVLEISLMGDTDETTLRHWGELLEDELLNVPGVATVRRIAWQDREYWVEADPMKLKEHHVTLKDLETALRSRNVTLPAGPLRTPDGQEYSVRIDEEFQTADDIAATVVRSNFEGRRVLVKDVATVRPAFEDPSRIARVNGQRALAMVVVKSASADLMKVVSRVNEVLKRFEERLPETLHTTITNDLSYYVKRRLGVLKNNGMIGFVLVLVILFIFLDPLPALVTTFGVPLAMLATFLVMAMSGMTINLVSMLGLILVLGMLVDDGIIVAENITRHIEKGKSAAQAAIDGVSEVMAPVTATVLTTMAAFGPLLFLKDIIGKFIKEIPIVVMVALSASLIEAFIVLPSHMADFGHWAMRAKSKTRLPNNHVPNGQAVLQRMIGVYRRVLNAALNRRYLIVFGVVFPLLFLSVYLYVFKMKKTLFSAEGVEQFFIRVEAPKGTSLERLEEMIQPVEALVAQLPKTELRAFRSYLGSIENEMSFDPTARRGTHLGQITVFLTPFQTRQRSTQEIAESLRRHFDDLEKQTGLKRITIFQPKPGPPVGRDVDVALQGESFPELLTWAQKVRDRLNSMPGVHDIEIAHDTGKKELFVRINEDKARRLGLSVEQAAREVRRAFEGGIATDIRPLKADEEIHVRVRFDPRHRSDRRAFDHIMIPLGPDGRFVPLTALADIEEREGVFRVNHQHGRRVVHVVASVDSKVTSGWEVNQQLQKWLRKELAETPQINVQFSGEYEEQQESMRNIITAFSFAIFLIFIILTAMFNSLIQPLIVMMAIPFGLIGVVLSFLAHNEPLGFFAMMGVVGLSGVVVKDSIVLVDFINKHRREGHDRRSSLIAAGCVRFRPVLMTSLTTIGGLVSVAYGWGGGDPFLKPLALAVVWGLAFATVLTLIVIPCLYAIVDDVREWAHRWWFFLRGLRRHQS